MRARVAMALCLAASAVIAAPSVAQGGGPDQADVFLQDPEDDVQVTFDGEPVAPAQGERWALHDLRSLEIDETPLNITFRLQMAQLQRDTNIFLADSVSAHIRFQRGELGYAVVMDRNMGLGPDVEPTYRAELEFYDERGFRTGWQGVEIQVDEAAAVMTVPVPRDLLVDDKGRIPLPGEALEDVWVEAWNFLTGSDPAFVFVDALREDLGIDAGPDSSVRILDRMPDEGALPYAVRTGFGAGHGASLSTQEPLRVSNGEATTVVYGLDLRHGGPDPLDFRLSAHDAPSGWDVWFPVQDAAVSAGELRTVPVAVRVPFAHSHGSIETVTVRAEAVQDRNVWAETDIGIHYTDVPQPSGHHDTVYLHTAKTEYISINGMPGDAADPVNPERLWMNTLEDDAGDEGVAASSSPMALDGRSAAGWTVRLTPPLAMGLDLATTSTGTATFEVRAQRPMDGLRLQGDIAHLDEGGNRTVLMTIAADGALDLGAQQEASVEATILPADFSRIPYAPGAHLEARLWSEMDDADAVLEGIRGGSLELLAGSMRLPLDEYHDVIDPAFASDQAFRLVSSVQERIAAPGSVVVFDARIEQEARRSGSYALDLTGKNAGWATVHGPPDAEGDGASLPVQVVVTVPPDAGEGDAMDALLEAVDEDDPLRRSLLRLVVRADPGGEAIDETDRILESGAAKRSPAAPLSLVGATLLVLAFRIRR